MSLEITQEKKLSESGDLHKVDKCEYNKDCNNPATVFVTTIFGKKHYCGYHFQLLIYKGNRK